MKTKDNKVTITQSFDWKEAASVEELQEALKPFGIHVYDDPMLDGTDSYGFVFSDHKLSKAELNKIANRFEDEDE